MRSWSRPRSNSRVSREAREEEGARAIVGRVAVAIAEGGALVGVDEVAGGEDPGEEADAEFLSAQTEFPPSLRRPLRLAHGHNQELCATSRMRSQRLDGHAIVKFY